MHCENLPHTTIEWRIKYFGLCFLPKGVWNTCLPGMYVPGVDWHNINLYDSINLKKASCCQVTPLQKNYCCGFRRLRFCPSISFWLPPGFYVLSYSIIPYTLLAVVYQVSSLRSLHFRRVSSLTRPVRFDLTCWKPWKALLLLVRTVDMGFIFFRQKCGFIRS